MKKIKISNRNQIIIIISAIFIMMLLLNMLTPLLADDFSYSFGLDGKIHNLQDIIENQINHYMTWGGRTVAHTVGQIFLMFPKMVFSFFNTIAYTLLLWLIYQHAKTGKEDRPLLLILIHLGLWFFLPVFGQTCLWLIGSCNYLWTMVLILFFLLIYRRKDSKHSKIWKCIGMLLLGIIAGWTNENTAFGLITIVSGFLIIEKVKAPKIKIEKWKICGLIGSIVGFIILIAAPGNFARNDVFNDNTFILIKLLKRVIDATLVGIEYLLPLIIITVILFTILIYKKKKIAPEIYLFLTGSFFTIYSMILSPTFPERAWFGVIVFALVFITSLLYQVDFLGKLYRYIIIDVILIATVMYIGQYIVASQDIRQLQATWNEREKIIEKQKKSGKENIKLQKYITINSKNPAYKLNDIGPDKDVWPNTTMADFYNIKGISQLEE